MSTIAIENKSYVEERRKKVSLKERIAGYYRKHQTDIAAGCLLMSGNASAANLYRVMNK